VLNFKGSEIKMLFELKDFSLSFDASSEKNPAADKSTTAALANEKLILKQLNLEIQVGEKVALIGKSGVGKSSLLNVLYTQQSGEIAYCTQDTQLIKGLSSYNNIYLAKLTQFSLWQNLLNLVTPNKQELNEISLITDTLQVSECLHRSINNISGGQQQRVAIARALYQNRRVFLGDEPVSHLDPVMAKEVIRTILARHSTSVVALHDKDLALAFFDRIIGLKQGVIVLDARVQDLTSVELEQLYL
jgi:phosphonate transport system ATP-binding protein